LLLQGEFQLQQRVIYEFLRGCVWSCTGKLAVVWKRGGLDINNKVSFRLTYSRTLRTNTPPISGPWPSPYIVLERVIEAVAFVRPW
jgi:hypothetical protein